MSRRSKIWLRIALALVGMLAIAAISGVLVLRSAWFHDAVRRRIVREIETATGGRAELGNFAFDWSSMVATVQGLVLHGKEGSTEQPLLRVQTVQVGLHVVSMLRRKVDLAFIRIDGLAGHVIVYPDRSTNLPAPTGQPSGTPWTQQLLDLAVGEYEITNGSIEYDSRNVPVNIRGRDLRAKMTLDTRTQHYRGEFSSQRTRVEGIGPTPFELGTTVAFSIEKTRLAVDRLVLTTKDAKIELTGALDDVTAPHGAIAVKATGSLREIGGWTGIPPGPQGDVSVDGQLAISFGTTFDYKLTGRLAIHRLGYTYQRLKIERAEARADVLLIPDHLVLSKLEGTALGARVHGQASLTNWRDFQASGELDGMSVRQAVNIGTDRAVAWNGTLAGKFEVSTTFGRRATKAQVNLAISPLPEGTPIEGHVDAAYDQAAGTVRLGQSWVATPATRLDLSGTLGQSLEVLAQSTNLDDVLPALAMISASAPKEMPMKLQNGGRATASGVAAGPFDDLHFTGQAAATNAILDGHLISNFTASVAANQREIRLDKLLLERGATRIEGQAALTARGGEFDDAGIAGQVTVRSASIAELAKEFGAGFEATGTANATLRLSGTLRKPEAQGTLQVDKPAAFGEQLDRLAATLRYTAGELQVTGGDATDGTGRLRFQGAYRHPEDDWKNGSMHFEITADNLPLTQIETLAKEDLGVEARLHVKMNGTARVEKGDFKPETIDGDATLANVTYHARPVGDATAKIETTGSAVKIQATARVKGVTLRGEGAWKLAGDDPGSAGLTIPRISLATINELRNLFVEAGAEQVELPFEGFVEGDAKISVALLKPADFRADLTLSKLQVNAKANQALRLGVQPQDVVLANQKPVSIEWTSKGVHVVSAQFTGRDTSLEASGNITFKNKTNNGETTADADLTLRGAVNLVVLQLLNPSLLARGSAAVQMQVRGSIVDPLLVGRMELQNASLYFGDLPNGIDKANGVLLFDRNRATIEKLTAETGGGTVKMRGFLEFGSAVVYRLGAEVTQVRVRYPDDVSTTFNAVLSLNGTPDNSTLSGNVTVNRASFTPRADLGNILALASRPTSAEGEQSEYLRGMQLDIHIETGPIFEFETSLTRDLHADADLRLRGTPFRPVLLGTISINQGELQVFGTKYTVNRGEVRFLNPVKIEPSFDMDLETKARGILVNITFSGTMQKLNVNYSSDPPLQSREIIALLAVGRDPNTSAGLASSQVSSGGFVEAGSGLLGQAVAAQLSSRVQRFFGASRVKIDPQLGGVENLPQARLTLEQQVSKDITLTYITNLNRTQEQLVRIEYDLSRNWSAVAVREGNGLFGIDFTYRKRFK